MRTERIAVTDIVTCAFVPFEITDGLQRKQDADASSQTSRKSSAHSVTSAGGVSQASVKSLPEPKYRQAIELMLRTHFPNIAEADTDQSYVDDVVGRVVDAAKNKAPHGITAARFANRALNSLVSVLIDESADPAISRRLPDTPKGEVRFKMTEAELREYIGRYKSRNADSEQKKDKRTFGIAK